MSVILGYSFSSYDEFSIVIQDLEYMLAYFLKLSAFFAFCLFAGVLVKRSAFAIGFVFIWFIVELIIRGMLRWKIIKDAEATDIVMGFFPLESMSNLIKEPFTRFQAYRALENQVAGTENIKYYGIHWYEWIIPIAWTAFFIYMSYRILKKRDL
jgi:hypothetical protein